MKGARESKRAKKREGTRSTGALSGERMARSRSLAWAATKSTQLYLRLLPTMKSTEHRRQFG